MLQASSRAARLLLLGAIVAGSPSTHAATVTDVLNVSATVLSSCALNGGTLSFGDYTSGQPTDLDVDGIINYVNCSGTLTFALDGGGSGNSNALAKATRNLIPRNFEPGFKVQLMNKDLETFTAIAKELHVPVSFANVAQRYQQAALAAGLGEQDTSVVYTLIERLAAIAQPR